MEEMEIVKPEKLKDVLIAKTAVKTMTPERIAEKIISFQFEDLRGNMRQKGELYLSGLGSFRITRKRLREKIDKLSAKYKHYYDKAIDMDTTDRVKGNSEGKVEEVKAQLLILNRIYETRFPGDVGRGV